MDGLTDFHQRDQRDQEYLERWLQFHEEEWPGIWARRVETIDAIPEPLGSAPERLTAFRWYTVA